MPTKATHSKTTTKNSTGSLSASKRKPISAKGARAVQRAKGALRGAVARVSASANGNVSSATTKGTRGSTARKRGLTAMPVQKRKQIASKGGRTRKAAAI